MPFSAGQRVCLGRTFAEINMRLIALYLTETFDFKFKDEKKYEGKENYPLAMSLQSKTPPVYVVYTKRP